MEAHPENGVRIVSVHIVDPLLPYLLRPHKDTVSFQMLRWQNERPADCGQA